MYYLLFDGGGFYRDYSLPSKENWNGQLTLLQSETAWGEDVQFHARCLDAQGYLAVPRGFTASKSAPLTEDGEILLRDGLRVVLQYNGSPLAIFVHVLEPEAFGMRKLLFPSGGALTIGRDANCHLRMDSEFLSGRHGRLMLDARGACTYEDTSTNGTFLNNRSLKNARVTLKPCDVLFFAPGIKLVFLGRTLAVNQLPGLDVSRLQPAPALPAAAAPAGEPASALVEYHRAPRLLQKPKQESVTIEPPLAKADGRDQPLILAVGPSLTMILPMLMGTMMTSLSSANGGGFMAAGITMMGTSSVLAVCWGLANTRHQKRQLARQEAKRQHVYQSYLNGVETQLRALYEEEYKRLFHHYLSLTECAQVVEDPSTKRLWERMPTHADFMHVRLGLGELPLPSEVKATKAGQSLTDDPLRDRPAELEETYSTLRDVPITLSLRTEPLVGILGGGSAHQVAMAMVVQLCALHSYHDVKIAVLTTEDQYSRWEWARWLPHAFASEDRGQRLIAGNPAAVRSVLGSLEEIIQMRKDAQAQEEESRRKKKLDDPNVQLDTLDLPLPHYVIFCMDPALMENEPIMSHLLSRTPGFTLVSAAAQVDRLPKECRVIISCLKQHPGIYTSQGEVTAVQMELPGGLDLPLLARRMAPLRVRDSSAGMGIPSIATFLEVYRVQQVEQLDIWRFWNENHAYEGLRSLIGLRAGAKPFELDISDKKHGPHGLVAGTTGSGKSVMLQTYILSLALCYHPQQVQFILIDYKGGGMADAFAELPHVAGSIDNLQGMRVIQRALASIQGEIRRRELIFKNFGVSNIDEYMRLAEHAPSQEPLSHLIIVVDEFAELKKEQPEFMRELISASRVGRSVGVHLILATQKPSNSVDDEIWSNARFRICLRVQTRGDSMDMLKRPEAAYIKGMGRCFIQIGNDEVFEELQTSWSGADYEPNRTASLEKPFLLLPSGERVKLAKPKASAKEHKLTQMDAVLAQIRAVMEKHELRPARRLWLDELPGMVFLEQIDEYRRNLYRGGVWNPPADGGVQAVIGLADDLQNQQHIPVTLDFTRKRNFLVVGLAATGKTSLLQTIGLSLCTHYTPEQVQLYVFSLSGHTLGCMSQLPHVGDVVYGEQPDECVRLLDMLCRENARRRELFKQASTDNFVAYGLSCDIRPELERVPAVVVMIDRMAQMEELLGDESKQKLYALIREGSSRGMFFAVTAMAMNEVYSRIQDCFCGIALQMHDRSDLADVLGKRLPPEMCDMAPMNGRAMMELGDAVYEMQVALYGDKLTDVERANDILVLGREMSAAWTGKRPARMPRIPEAPDWRGLWQTVQAAKTDTVLHWPLGYLRLEGMPALAELRRQYAWLVLGGSRTGKTSFLKGMAHLFAQEEADIHWISASRQDALPHGVSGTQLELEPAAMDAYQKELEGMILERNQARKAVAQQGEEALLRVSRGFHPYVILLDNLGDVLPRLTPMLKQRLAESVSLAAGYRLYLFVTVGSGSAAALRSEPLYQALVAQQNGIALRGRLGDVDPWNVQASYADRNAVLPQGEAFLVDQARLQRLVLPLDWVREVRPADGGEEA